MIVCRKCSRRHADGTEFCACGAFLEFDGERIADPDPPPGTTVTTPPPLAPPGNSGWSHDAGSSGRGQAAEPAPWSGLPSAEGGWRAEGSGSVDARLPDSPVQAASTEPVWVEPSARPGDVACASCGTANPPDRQFCRHCGQPLGFTGAIGDPADRGGRVRWWQRLTGSARRRARRVDTTSLANQARRASHGGLSGRSVGFRTGAVVVVLGGLLAFLGPWKGTVIARSKDVIGVDRYREVTVASEQLSVVTAQPGASPTDFPLQPADNLVDGFRNTSWATQWLDVTQPGFEAPPAAAGAAPEDGACQPVPFTDSYLRIEFADEIDLARLRILAGRMTDDESRDRYSRPRVVELQVNDGPCSYAQLEADGELETVEFDHDDVTNIDLRVVGVDLGGEEPGTVEISEILFDR